MNQSKYLERKKNSDRKFPGRKLCTETYMNQSCMFKCMCNRKVETEKKEEENDSSLIADTKKD